MKTSKKSSADLCHFKVGISEVDDLPRQEFRSAVQLYLIGLFENAIHRACFSVEMALLVELNEKLPENEKKAIHDAINPQKGKPVTFTFGSMFDKAKSKETGIIKGAELTKKFATIIEKRNTYIHASNFLAATNNMLKDKVAPEIESILKNIELLENSPFLGTIVKNYRPGIPKIKEIVMTQQKLIKSIPDFSWCSKDKIRLNAENQMDEYFQKLENIKKEKVDLSTNYTKLVSALKLKGTVTDILSDVYLKDESKEIIECAFEILKEIGFFTV